MAGIHSTEAHGRQNGAEPGKREEYIFNLKLKLHSKLINNGVCIFFQHSNSINHELGVTQSHNVNNVDNNP